MPVKDNVHGAQFDRRIQIQAPSRVSDGQGGETITWNTVYTCWADMQNFPRGRGLTRKFMAQQLYPQLTTIIQIRWQPTYHIDPSMRISYTKGPLIKIFQILGIESPGDANISMFFFCQENQTVGYN